MSKRTPSSAPVRTDPSSKPDKSETFADRTRSVAESIKRLPHQIVESFTSTDPGERARRMKAITGEISSRMFPVLDWLERRRPLEKADLVKSRLFPLLDEADKCVMLHIPEYEGGTIARQSGDHLPSEGAKRTALIVVQARLFAASLMQWAADIQAEEEQSPGRVTIDAATHSVTVNGGRRIKLDHPAAFALFERIAKGNGQLVTTSELHGLPGCKSRIDRILREHLPSELRRLISSKKGNGGGYWLSLPTEEVRNCP